GLIAGCAGDRELGLTVRQQRQDSQARTRADYKRHGKTGDRADDIADGDIVIAGIPKMDLRQNQRDIRFSRKGYRVKAPLIKQGRSTISDDAEDGTVTFEHTLRLWLKSHDRRKINTLVRAIKKTDCVGDNTFSTRTHIG